GQAPITFIWEVPAAFRADRSFGVICEVLQDAERYAGENLAVTAVCL
ncbi:MAG TPA: barnase inhibitor, partial [Arthrobacter sp.]